MATPLLLLRGAACKTFPLAFSLLSVLVAVKLYKVTFAVWPISDAGWWQRPTLVEAVLQIVRSPLFAGTALLCGVAVWWQRTRLPARQRCIVICLVVAALVCIKVVRAIQTGGGWSSLTQSWLVSEAIDDLNYLGGILSLDIVTGAVFWIGATLVGVLALGRFGKVVFAVLILATFVLESIVALELAHYLEMGIGGTGELLLHFVQNATKLWAVIGGEIDSRSIIAIATPLLLGVLAFLIGAKLSTKSRFDRLPNKAVLPATCVAMCVPVVVPFKPANDFLRLEGNALYWVASDMATHIRSRGPDEALIAEIPVATKTGEARLVPEPGSRRMNVVLILLESVRAEATTVYAPHLKTTPFLAELAQESIVVEEMYAVVPRTMSSWVATLMGVHPAPDPLLMAWGAGRHERLTSLPKLLKPIGYRSAYFQSATLDFANEINVIQAIGFDHIVDMRDLDKETFERVNDLGLEDRAILEPIRTWLDHVVPAEEPFLLVTTTNTSHMNYQTPSYWPITQFASGASERKARYLNAIAYTDDFLSQLYGELVQRDLLTNTVLIVLGDHGEAFGEHGYDAGHGYTLHQNTLHVPMLIHAPVLFPVPATISGPRQQIDLIPTIVDLLGFRLENAELPGVSLLTPPDQDRILYFSSFLDRIGLGVLKSGRKFIYHFDRRPMEVYDLNSDPGELHNVAHQVPDEKKRQMELLMRSLSVKVAETFR